MPANDEQFIKDLSQRFSGLEGRMSLLESWEGPKPTPAGYIPGDGVRPFLDPTPYTWTLVNQGTGSGILDTENTRLALIKNQAGAGTYDLMAYSTPVTVATFTAVMFVDGILYNNTLVGYGVFVRNGGTAKLLTSLIDQTNTYHKIWAYTNPTTLSSQYAATLNNARYRWHRIRVDATTVYFDVSSDGLTWLTIFSQLLATFIGSVDSIGFCLQTTNAAANIGGMTTLFHFEIA